MSENNSFEDKSYMDKFDKTISGVDPCIHIEEPEEPPQVIIYRGEY